MLLAAPVWAQQIIPPKDLYCAAQGTPTRLTSLRFSLLEGKTVRKYRDFDLTALKLGENTVTFTKVATAVAVNGMRIDPCDIELDDLVAENPAGQRWKTRVYNLKVGEEPTVKFELLPHPDGKPGGYIVIRGKGTL